MNDQISSFGELFRIARLRANIPTLSHLSEALAEHGLIVDTSLLSHWQRGARLPKDRNTILCLIKVLALRNGLSSPSEANRLSELSGMGYLTEAESQQLFPQLKKVSRLPSQQPLRAYFTASERGRGELGAYYEQIFTVLQDQLDFVVDSTVANNQQFYNGKYDERSRIFTNAMHYLHNTNLVVLEISTPSLSMGYVLRLALELRKPVIALYTADSLPYFASLIPDNHLQVLYYSGETLKTILSQAVEYIDF